MQVNMTLKKSTKNTHVDEAVGTAIQRNELPEQPPKIITIEVIW